MMNEGLTRRSVLAGVAAGVLASTASLRAQSSDPTSLTIDEIRTSIAARKLSPVEITRAYLARIEKLNPRINAYITVTGDSALKQAQGARGRARQRPDTRSAARHPYRPQGQH
jgi:hypothetical protein